MWNKFFQVEDGHLHVDMCSRVYALWIPAAVLDADRSLVLYLKVTKFL